MTVNSKPRLGGWLMVPLAWLIVTLLASALVITLLVLRPVPMSAPQPVLLQWGASLATSALMLVYTAWITWIFCQRSQRLPRHYTLWLLLNVVLAVKTLSTLRFPIIWRCARYCSPCWRPVFWCLISSVLSGLKPRLSPPDAEKNVKNLILSALLNAASAGAVVVRHAMPDNRPLFFIFQAYQ